MTSSGKVKFQFPKLSIGPAGTRGNGALKEIPLISSEFKVLELSFTHGVNMKEKTANKVGKLVELHGTDLSIHAPYFINLLTNDREKLEKSKNWILETCRIGELCKAKYIVFHVGYYGENFDSKKRVLKKGRKHGVYKKVKKVMTNIMATIKKKGWTSILCPETTGKKYQFGTVEELVKLSGDCGSGVCFDFAHVLARNGSIDYDTLLPIVKSVKRRTAHFSGIEYNDFQGEVRHKRIGKKKTKKLFKKLIQHEVDLRIICESSSPFSDSQKMKKLWKKLRKKEKKKQKTVREKKRKRFDSDEELESRRKKRAKMQSP